jgi:hypothetical protein
MMEHTRVLCIPTDLFPTTSKPLFYEEFSPSGERHLKTEAQIEKTHLTKPGAPTVAGNHQNEAWNRLPLRASRKTQPCLYLYFRLLASKTVREKFVVIC